MNKIIYILCSAFFWSLMTVNGFSQQNGKPEIVKVKSDTLLKLQKSDTIKRKLQLDSIQTLSLLKSIMGADSTRRKLATDTLNKRIKLDSVQTKRLLEKFMSDIVKKKKKKTKKDIEYEVDGLIVARTISRAGRDFYDIFFSKWEPPKGVSNYIIEIIEKPFPQMGTEVSVKIKEVEIFKERLQPRYDIVEQYAGYAIMVSKNFLKRYKEIQKELAGEDLSGSGIF